ncbi:MAG TPA: hypothetical protein VNI20_11485 [Fimbriimonadaceae bacterium]|nr:hypothetical protein [Fimbriimonadaceae bacterium]
MTTLDDIRRICSRLPGAEEGSDDRFGFGIEVKGKIKGFIWSWNERVHPKKARVANDRVLAILTPNLAIKEAILESDSDRFFTEQHYNGFPAVLVRLDNIDPNEIEDLIIEAWKCKAPKELLTQYSLAAPPILRTSKKSTPR